MAPATHSLRNRLLARGTSAVLLVIGALALVHSLGWRGARFPGFFVMPNRVVPSAALPGWSGVAEGRPLYQNILLAVDGVPIAAAEDGYRRAAAHSAGEPRRLSLRTRRWARDAHVRHPHPRGRGVPGDLRRVRLHGARLLAARHGGERALGRGRALPRPGGSRLGERGVRLYGHGPLRAGDALPAARVLRSP